MPDKPMHRCVTLDRTGHEVSSESETRFGWGEMVRRDGSGRGDVYELSLHDEASGDGRSIELELPVSGIPYDRTTMSLEESTAEATKEPVLEVSREGGAGDTVEYRELAGWIAHPPKYSKRALSVSISGMAPDVDSGFEGPRRIHVWGVYPVERVEGGGADRGLPE